MSETAREWFDRKVKPASVSKFELVDTDLFEFTAMIAPLMSDVPLEYDGIVYRMAPSFGADWAIEYG